jgi:hypothetical protein
MPWILNVVKWMNILMSKWISRERLTCPNSKAWGLLKNWDHLVYK